MSSGLANLKLIPRPTFLSSPFIPDLLFVNVARVARVGKEVEVLRFAEEGARACWRRKECKDVGFKDVKIEELAKSERVV